MTKQKRSNNQRVSQEKMTIITKTNEVSISLPLISLRGYALMSEDVSRMRKNAEEELQETRKELGYAY